MAIEDVDTFAADMALLNEESTDVTPPKDEEALEPLTPIVEDDKEPVKNEEGDETDKGEDPKPEDKIVEIRHGRPTLPEIKSKYPDFFKVFPDMRHMLFREGEYSAIFPTVDDAKEAASKSEDFERIAELVNSGTQKNFVEFLKGIDEGGPATLINMAANFLPALYELKRDLYFQVTSPIAESLIKNAYKVGVNSGNENLKNAALQVALWAFGDVGFADGSKSSPPLKPTEVKSDEKFEKEKRDFYEGKRLELRSYVDTQAVERMSREIKTGLDPNGVFNEFTSRLLIKQVFEEVGTMLEADKAHMATMNSLWKNAHKAGYSGNWKDRLLTTYLSRARAVMPAIRSRIRAQALADAKDASQGKEQVATRSVDRKEIGGSGSPAPKANGKTPDAREVDWGSTSDLDFLNDKVTLKRRN